MDEKIKACPFCGSAAKISKVNARFMKGRAKKKKYNIYYSIGCLPRKMRRERMSTINREEAIRWVQTECNPYGKPTLDYDSGVKVIEHLEKMRPAENHMPSAQPDVPDMNDGDMISRQVAMEMLMAQNVIMDGSEYHNGFNAGVNRAQEVIRNLPPVQPKRKTGQWIERESDTEDKENGFETVIVCSRCDYPATTFYSEDCESRTQIRTAFCPTCGADMRGGKDGTD